MPTFHRLRGTDKPSSVAISACVNSMNPRSQWPRRASPPTPGNRCLPDHADRIRHQILRSRRYPGGAKSKHWRGKNMKRRVPGWTPVRFCGKTTCGHIGPLPTALLRYADLGGVCPLHSRFTARDTSNFRPGVQAQHLRPQLLFFGRGKIRQDGHRQGLERIRGCGRRCARRKTGSVLRDSGRDSRRLADCPDFIFFGQGR